MGNLSQISYNSTTVWGKASNLESINMIGTAHRSVAFVSTSCYIEASPNGVEKHSSIS
jgi:hypothetical protein